MTKASILREIMSGDFGENADKDVEMMTLELLLRGRLPVVARVSGEYLFSEILLEMVTNLAYTIEKQIEN